MRTERFHVLGVTPESRANLVHSNFLKPPCSLLLTVQGGCFDEIPTLCYLEWGGLSYFVLPSLLFTI